MMSSTSEINCAWSCFLHIETKILAVANVCVMWSYFLLLGPPVCNLSPSSAVQWSPKWQNAPKSERNLGEQSPRWFKECHWTCMEICDPPKPTHCCQPTKEIWFSNTWPRGCLLGQAEKWVWTHVPSTSCIPQLWGCSGSQGMGSKHCPTRVIQKHIKLVLQAITTSKHKCVLDSLCNNICS